MKQSIRYYFHLGWFQFREPFSDLKTSFVNFLLYAFFIVLLAQLWQRFNSVNSLFLKNDVFLYIGVTEALFLTFLRSRIIASSAEDFALSLVKPRSWILREIVTLISSTLGQRLTYAAALIPTLILCGAFPHDFGLIYFRFLLVLIVLSLPQALLSLTFSTLRLSYAQTDYFILPFSKIFLALGGVFGPLSDYGQPWKSFFLQLPGSDLFFQPAHFVVKGFFYETTYLPWLGRVAMFCLIFIFLNFYFYSKGRKAFQAWGG